MTPYSTSALAHTSAESKGGYTSLSIIRLSECRCGSPANLKEAIDWILRVTGKYGGGGDSTNDLTNQVKDLLEKVKGSDRNLDVDIESVMSALDGGQLIAKLAEGLQQFIGYEKGGTIKQVTDGIGLYNDPLQRLRTGVLVFVYGMITKLKEGKYLDSGQAEAAIKTIMSGREKFDDAVKSELTLTANGNSNFQKVLDALKKVTDLKGDSLSTLAGAFKKYLGNVLKQVEEDSNVSSAKITTANDVKHLVTELKNNFAKVVEALKTQNPKQPIDFGQGDLKKHVDAIYDNNKGTFRKLYDAVNHKSPKIKQPKAKDLVYAVYISTSSSLSQLQKGYKSYYQGVVWPKDTSSHKKCAKIFLSCLPLIFSNLQHLYWKCKHDKAHGGWKEMQLDGKGTDEGKDLKNFMDLMSLSPNWLNGGKKGGDVESVMKTSFSEFATAANGTTTSYADFLKTFRGNCLTTWQSKSTTATASNFLSGLYLCSTSYFRHQHQKRDAQARPPSSIREMLYWLMGLTATPQFGDLLGHIHNVVGSDFKVAVSGSAKKDETLSADQVTSYILSTCYTSPSVLNVIQGSVAFNTLQDDPWLHDIYSNDAFPFKYPTSGPALFYALSDYTYALQFQLGFLYQQCSQLYVNTCGWFMCNYGQGVNTIGSNGKVVSSHICPVGCSNPNHTSDDYNSHKSTYCQHAECGTSASKPSPLQAFLTDKLKGFSRGHPSGHSAHLSTCSGFLCHVPMGFESHLRDGKSSQGGHISPTLKSFCGSSNTPLCQLSETLTCLSKRTPRTLGDIFGFIWHLNSQLFKANKPADDSVKGLLESLGVSVTGKLPDIHPSEFLKNVTSKIAALKSSPQPKAIEKALSMFPGLPFWYNLFMIKPDDSLPARLFRLKSTDHNTRGPSKYAGEHNDLYSLYNQMCNDSPNNTCGKYLYPLCYSNGATFNPKSAITYLSWVLYLTDDLQYKFQELLDDFTNIDCSKSGCGGLTKCSEHHTSETHGTPSGPCSCPSVVQCGGVLPLLYGHGFRFYDAIHLKNGSKGNGGDVRKCSAFAAQLKSVLAGKPLTNLLTTIDTFLYAIRWEFFSKVSGFWTIYMCLILYTFLFLLDTLHVRSHLKLTSRTVPPIGLLTSGKPLPITTLTYIGQ